mmetsp:Transcript_9757/g.24018  ORF Transcript_9757/g.24018 Transcript_9757/m.24018 type:complete len:86 (+) Transcript_9757:269-526(+)
MVSQKIFTFAYSSGLNNENHYFDFCITKCQNPNPKQVGDGSRSPTKSFSERDGIENLNENFGSSLNRIYSDLSHFLREASSSCHP